MRFLIPLILLLMPQMTYGLCTGIAPDAAAEPPIATLAPQPLFYASPDEKPRIFKVTVTAKQPVCLVTLSFSVQGSRRGTLTGDVEQRSAKTRYSGALGTITFLVGRTILAGTTTYSIILDRPPSFLSLESSPISIWKAGPDAAPQLLRYLGASYGTYPSRRKAKKRP